MRQDQAYAMHQAIERGDAAALDRLLADEPRLTGTPVPVPCAWGEEMWLGLHLAAGRGEAELVRLLLRAGASIDARTRFRTPMHARETALLIAARLGHEQTARLLIDAHADVSLLDANHRAALSHAAEAGHAGVVRLLLSYGAGADPVDDQLRTPLHWAIAGGHEAAALALIDAGADVDHACPREPAGYTPLHRCVTQGQPMRAVFDRLIERGADRTLRDPRHGRTAQELMNT